MKLSSILMAALVVAGFSLTSVRAEGEGKAGKQQQPTQIEEQAISQQLAQQADQPQPAQPRRYTVTGRLIESRQFTLGDQGERHVLAKLSTQDNKTVVLDLGSVADVQRADVDLERNEQYTASGFLGRINGQPVLVTEVLSDDDDRYVLQQLTIRPEQPAITEQAMAEKDQQLKQVQGRVVAVREINLRQLGEPHQLAKIETSGGQVVLVDLGKEQDLANLQLNQGDYAAVAGLPGEIDDQPVIFATQVAKIAQIDRSNLQPFRGAESDDDFGDLDD